MSNDTPAPTGIEFLVLVSLIAVKKKCGYKPMLVAINTFRSLYEPTFFSDFLLSQAWRIASVSKRYAKTNPLSRPVKLAVATSLRLVVRNTDRKKGVSILA